MHSFHSNRLARAALAVITLGFPTSLALAVQPQIGAIDPPGVQRGVETEIVLSGARLEDAQQLLLYSPGIEVVSLEPSAGAVKAKLKVAPDCRLGFHAVRVRTETGLSNLRLFGVGALPQVAETEPNNEFAAPQAIAMDSTVIGVIQNEDVDHFVVEARQGQRITAELEGLRLANSFFDPYLAILNEQRFELARSDDAALLRQDCLCSILAPADGKYIIQVRESAYGGDGNAKYRLHVGRFPRPTAVIPSGGRPGETLEVTWIGDAAGEKKQQVTLPASTADGESHIFAQDEQGIAPSGNGIRLSDLPNAVEAEPNNSIAEATAATAPGALHGVIGSAGDVDHFKFSAKKDARFDIRVFARSVLRSRLDPVLVIRNAAGGGIVSNDDNGGPDSYLQFAAPADGDYIAEISDHLRSGGVDFAYRIEIAPIVPRLTMALPEKVQYESTTLMVPRGNRMALMVAARRENFGGDVNLTFENLPPGVTAEALPIPSGQSEVPVLFSAAADAAPAGTLVDIQGRPSDQNVAIVGRLNQRSPLIRGQNNIDVYGHNAERMAAAVTKEVPFKLDIVQPQAPIVRNGSMNLKIVATRAGDYKAPIAVRMLYNPPGISSSGSISIPEGQSEAVIPLNANGGAAIGTWKIAVLGTAAVGNGQVEVSTQLADLAIADTFFDLTVGKTAVEKGKETQIVVDIAKKKDFAGNAQIELLGLPAGATTTPLEFNKDAAQVVFVVKTEATARPGKYTNLVCRAVAIENGEPVTHTLGSGELRIDEPLPPKVAQAQPATQPTQPAPQPAPTEAPKKPLSRLEQLRQAKGM